jgi:hypothetical protein
MSTVIKKKPGFRRMRPRQPLVEGDVESAEAVTHRRLAETQTDGTTMFKNVLESLDSKASTSTPAEMLMDPPPPTDDYFIDPMADISPPSTPRPKKSRVSADFS